MKAFLCSFCITLLLLQQTAMAAPSQQVDAEASGSFKIPPLLTFDNGNIGVNFLGFKASAGLGGLLTGDMSQGGLHAAAETPFGQKAGAGLGGMVGGDGRSTGGLYAGATAGGGVGAGAGLGGTAGAEGSMGRSYAGASAGGLSKTVIKEKYGGPAPVEESGTGSAAVGGSFGGSIGFKKTVHIAPVVVSKPAAEALEIVETQPVAEVPKKTYIERTVIPNYVEKTIQVPSYVEKTIRVPTVVEKKIKVPAAPTIIEKTVDVPPAEVDFKNSVVIEKEATPTIKVVEKTKYRQKRPHLHYRKRFYLGGDAGSYGSVFPPSAGAAGAFGVTGNGYQEIAPAPAPYAGTYRATIRKSVNPQLIRDIFNIPIATLGAVSNLVGGIAGGGSVSVSKSIEKSY